MRRLHVHWRPASAGLLLAVVALVGACSAQPDPDSPGTCPLSCSGGGKEGANDFKIVPLNTAGITIQCLAGSDAFKAAGSNIIDLSGPVTVRFRVTETVTAFGDSGAPAG